MEKDSRIYVAGHNGLVGSAIVRKLKENNYKNINTYLTNYGYYLVKKLSAHDYLYTKTN